MRYRFLVKAEQLGLFSLAPAPAKGKELPRGGGPPSRLPSSTGKQRVAIRAHVRKGTVVGPYIAQRPKAATPEDTGAPVRNGVTSEQEVGMNATAEDKYEVSVRIRHTPVERFVRTSSKVPADAAVVDYRRFDYEQPQRCVVQYDLVVRRNGRQLEIYASRFSTEALANEQAARIIEGDKVRRAADAAKKAKTVRQTCSFCFATYGVRTGRIASHGYKAPGRGTGYAPHIGGSCSGDRYAPLEVSPEGTLVAMGHTAADIAQMRARLAELKADGAGLKVAVEVVDQERTTLRRRESRVQIVTANDFAPGAPRVQFYHYGSHTWAEVVRDAIKQTDQRLKHAELYLAACREALGRHHPGHPALG